MKKIFFTLFLIFPSLILYPQDTLNVPLEYPTIQAAINASTNGDIVLVEDGTYIENINYRGKAITVASHFIIDSLESHIENTIIDGSQPSNPDSASVITFNSGEDTTSILYGFTITGGSGSIIPGQNTKRGGGVVCYQSGARIEFNIIENNEIIHQDSARGGGICVSNMSPDPQFTYVIIENNKIRDNRCESDERNAFGAGIYLRGEGRIVSNNIINNEVQYNGGPGNQRLCIGGGISCGWWSSGYTFVKIFDNLIANNRALSPLAAGYCGGVDLIRTNCDFRGNTVKDNRISGNPYAYGGGMRVLLSVVSTNVSENNFINNGPLNINDIVIGGGLLTVQTENLTIENNVFQFNSGAYGGGIYISEDSLISVRNNKFLQNSATDGGGGIFISQSSPLFENNLVAGNTAWGGGGFGIYCTGSNSYEKLVMASQMIMTGGLGEITNENIFHSPFKINTTLIGEPLFINNTIVDNSATAQGGGIYIENTQATIINTILWGNTAALDSQLYSINGTFLLEYSDIQGWDTTNNTINDVDPLFEDTLYNLTDTSLCIGAGIDSTEINGIWYYAPLDDIEGNPRPNPPGSMPDIGAYESPLALPVYVEKYETLIPVVYVLRQNYPNPFNPNTTIEFALPAPGFVTLGIFNILGEKVATPVSEYLTAGSYKYHWDAKGLTSGVYLYKLEASNNILVRKMILLR